MPPKALLRGGSGAPLSGTTGCRSCRTLADLLTFEALRNLRRRRAAASAQVVPAVAVGGDLGAVGPVVAHAADVGQEHPGLAGDVGAHEPAVGVRVERVPGHL